MISHAVLSHGHENSCWVLLTRRYDICFTRRYFNTFFNRTSMMKCMTGKIFLIQKSHKQCIIWTEQWKRPENSNQCLYDWMQPLRPIYIHLTSLTIHCLAYSCNFIDTSALCWPWGDTRGCLCAVSDINNLVCWLWECMIMWMYVCTVFAVKLNCLRVH